MKMIDHNHFICHLILGTFTEYPYVSGFKYREIADKLGLPLGTVKSRIYFTRQKLQEELKDFR